MLTVQLLIAILTLVWAYIIIRTAKIDNRLAKIKDPSNSKLYLLPVFSIAAFFTIFRAESTSVDYITYRSINNILFENTWTNIWDISYIDMEPLLLALIKILSYLEMGLIPFLFVTTLTVLTVYYRAIRKYSKIVWLSVFLIFCFASYFTIFNTTAQMFASLIIFAGSAFIYKGHFWKYLLVIIFAALFHKTALFMIPMYFLLRFRIDSLRMSRSLILVGVILLIGLYFFLDKIVGLGTTLFFPEYIGKIAELPTVSPLVAIKPILILGFVFAFRKYLNLKDMKERVWFNSLIYVAILTVFAINFGLMQRFVYFLLPYTVLIVPLVISRMATRQRGIAIASIVFIGLAYILLTNNISTTPFSFIWEIPGKGVL